MNIWRFPYYINKPSLVPIALQLFKWGHFSIFSLSYNLTSDDHWPWYVAFDLINKLGFPCCIYDPTLVKIHQSMWKLEPIVNPFSRQQTTTIGDKVIPMCLSCYSRWHKKCTKVEGCCFHHPFSITWFIIGIKQVLWVNTCVLLIKLLDTFLESCCCRM